MAVFLFAGGFVSALVWWRLAFLTGLAEVGHELAGLGDLAWQRADGEWVDVALVDTSRRQWGPTDRFLEPGWQALGSGIRIADLRLRRSPNPVEVDVVLVSIAPRRVRFRVVGEKDWRERVVGEVAEERHFAVAVNASYFSDEGPLGLVVTDGTRRRRAVAHRASHLLIDGPGRLPRIVNERGADTTGVNQGFQGFPAIMSDGVTYGYMRAGGRGFDIWKIDRRTAACTTRDGELLLLVTDTLTNGLSFEELATLLGGLGCIDAMGFDGGSSTALEVHVGAFHRSVGGIRPVQVVLGATITK